MSLPDRIVDLSSSIAAAAGAAVVSGVAWLVRRVLTNQKQVDALLSEIKARDRQRVEDREARDQQRAEDREDRAEMKAELRAVREKLDRAIERGILPDRVGGSPPKR